MANMSTAHGEVRSYAKTKEGAERVLNVIHRELGDADYNTCIDECRDGTLAAECTGEEWMAESRFTGTGRWVFEANIHRLSDWLGKAINELKDIEFRIEFDYADYEPGCEVLCKEEMVGFHEKGEMGIQTEVSAYSDYDMVAREIRALGFEEEGDIMDLNDPKDSLMKWFIDLHGEEYADDIRTVFGNEEAWKKFRNDFHGSLFVSWSCEAEDMDWRKRAEAVRRKTA